ncbi:MAG: hypothetical protein JO273_16440 [Methylobacteriaceae bacterium]|nr:hypothetical protein [Methylobacteriaceae bacterium]
MSDASRIPALASRAGGTAVLPGLVDPAALVAGESRADFEALHQRIAACVKPADVIEEILVADVVLLLWEALRLRRVKARLLEATTYRGIERIASPYCAYPPRYVSENWARGHRRTMRLVEKSLASAGLTMEHVAAHTFVVMLDTIERLDRLMAATEQRRSAALQEIDRHRAVLARDLRRAVEEAEFEVVVPAMPPDPDPAGAEAGGGA